MKKLLFVIILLIFLCGCSQKNTVEFNSSDASMEESAAEPQTENNDESKTEHPEHPEHEEETSEKDYEVEIIQTMISLNTNIGIEEYIESLKQSNNERNYTVYDDTHYSYTIMESERIEYLKNLIDNKELETAFNEIFTAEEYKGAFLSMDYNNNFTEVNFYIDKQKYDSIGKFSNVMPILTSSLVSDTVQAYNLIPIEERGCIVKIIDNETKEVVYDSSLE